ncbi:telethonin [Echeneis naucrates]|uniref:Telethonin-like n=1 Tax=Echeneis naucrates TaxID=173247 RepID=A0A665T218_ECHNA|nr:telethonin-like [Echeneis naucrates]
MHCVSRGGSYLVNSCCELHEENHLKKESYHACWLSLVIETRPQHKLALLESNSTLKESYNQQQVVHLMAERILSQSLRLGSYSRAMKEHHLPLFNISSEPYDARASFGCMEKQEERVDKQKGTGITQDSSKPVRVNFRASSLMSSPREVSHRVQWRE